MQEQVPSAMTTRLSAVSALPLIQLHFPPVLLNLEVTRDMNSESFFYFWFDDLFFTLGPLWFTWC